MDDMDNDELIEAIVHPRGVEDNPFGQIAHKFSYDDEPQSMPDGIVVDADAVLAELDTAIRGYGCWPTEHACMFTDRMIVALKRYLDAGGARPNWKAFPRAAGEYRWRMRHSRKNAYDKVLFPGGVAPGDEESRRENERFLRWLEQRGGDLDWIK